MPVGQVPGCECKSFKTKGSFSVALCDLHPLIRVFQLSVNARLVPLGPGSRLLYHPLCRQPPIPRPGHHYLHLVWRERILRCGASYVHARGLHTSPLGGVNSNVDLEARMLWFLKWFDSQSRHMLISSYRQSVYILVNG